MIIKTENILRINQLIKINSFLFLIFIYSFNSFGQTNSNQLYLEYGFDKYSVETETFKVSYDELIFTKGTENFKTRIKSALNENVNYAGHCILLFWGCGTGCQQSAIIDTKTKKVIFGPNSTSEFIYFPNSKLLISNPKYKDAQNYIIKKSGYYTWENDSLQFLKTQNW